MFNTLLNGNLSGYNYVVVLPCVLMHGFALFCFDCLPTMNFCGHNTKWNEKH